MKPIVVNYAQLVPRFIRKDKTGHALCEAINVAIHPFLTAMVDADACISDPSTMPEWALDEKAWENAILYDYSAAIGIKRQWVTEAVPSRRLYGTAYIIYRYLQSIFDNVEIEEWWQYGGNPYLFRVTVSGEWNAAREAWVRTVIGTAKNVRSELDTLSLGSIARIRIDASRAYWLVVYPMTGELEAGTWPDINVIAELREPVIQLDTSGIGYETDVTLCGTYPDTNIALGLQRPAIQFDAEGTGYETDVPMCGTINVD